MRGSEPSGSNSDSPTPESKSERLEFLPDLALFVYPPLRVECFWVRKDDRIASDRPYVPHNGGSFGDDIIVLRGEIN